MRLISCSGLASVTLLAAACGGDDGETPLDAAAASNPGFSVPTMATKANMKVGDVWNELGDADWSCLGMPSTDQPSTTAVTLTGRINDFQSRMGIEGATTVTAFPGINLAGNSGTAMTDTTANRGSYSMTLAPLPAGTTRYGFKFENADYVKTYLLNQYFSPASPTAMRDMAAISESTATLLPSFVGAARDPLKGVLAGAMRDCQGREVSNAVATVSSVAGASTHLTGARTFYFSAAAQSLPVRTNVRPMINQDGLFVVLDLPPQTAPAFIQVWGFRTAAEVASGQLTLLSELAAPVEANAVITASVEVKRQ